MKLTGWTNINNPNYIEPLYERLKYRNKEKKFIKPEDLKKYASEHNITNDEAAKILLDAFDKIPDWTDERKANEYENINNECIDCLIDYCVNNRIFITDYEHQGEDWGVPVFDNKWKVSFTLRSWSGIMAEVWNKILGIDSLTYLDFYCYGNRDGLIKDYKKPNDL